MTACGKGKNVTDERKEDWEKYITEARESLAFARDIREGKRNALMGLFPGMNVGQVLDWTYHLKKRFPQTFLYESFLYAPVTSYYCDSTQIWVRTQPFSEWLDTSVTRKLDFPFVEIQKVLFLMPVGFLLQGEIRMKGEKAQEDIIHLIENLQQDSIAFTTRKFEEVPGKLKPREYWFFCIRTNGVNTVQVEVKTIIGELVSIHFIRFKNFDCSGGNFDLPAVM